MARNTTLVGGALIFHDHIYGVDNDGTKNGLCSFTGIIGDVVNIFTKTLARKGYRCILERGTDMGIYNQTSDSYTGLLGRLQRGEIDIVTVPVYYPLMDSNDKFRYTAALYGDTMTLCSGYHINEESHEGRLFTMFTTVPYGLWIGYFLSFLLFIALSIYGTRKLKRSYPSIWTMISAFMEQYYFPSGSRFISVISFVVSISVYIMMTYAKNSMRTDLVTIDRPIVITTYDEIIDHGIKVAFAKVIPEWEQFHNAPTGSKERALFSNHVPITLTPGTANRLIKEMMDQSMVVIGRPMIGYTTALMQLGFGNFPKDGRFYLAPDESAKKYTNVFAMSSRMEGTHAMKMAYDMIQMMNERGFYQYLMDHVPTLICTLVHGNLGSAPSLHEKISPQIEVGKGDVNPIGWQHFSQVTYLLYAGLTAASIVLFLERIWFIVIVLVNSVSAEPSRRRRRRRRVRL